MLTLDMAAADEVDTPSWEAPLRVRVRFVFGGDGTHSPWWMISGRIRRAFVQRPNVLAFDGAMRVVRGSSAPPIRTFEVKALDCVASISLHNLKNVRAWAARSKRGWQVRVQPRSDLPVGPFRGELQVSVLLQSGERIPSYGLVIKGRCVDDLEFVPPVLDLGGVEPQGTVRGDVLLHSQLGEPLSIDAISTDSPELKCTVESLAGAQAQLAIVFRPRLPGRFKGSVRVLARTPSTPLSTLELAVDASVLPTDAITP